MIVDAVEPAKEALYVALSDIAKRYRVNARELFLIWLPFHHIELVPLKGKRRDVFIDDFLVDKLTNVLTKPLIARKKIGKVKKINLESRFLIVRPKPIDYYRIVYDLQKLLEELRSLERSLLDKLREVKRINPPDRRRRILAIRMELAKIYAGISALREVFGKEVMEKRIVFRVYFKRFIWRPLLIALTDRKPLIIDACKKRLELEPVYNYILNHEENFVDYLNQLVSMSRRSAG